MPPQLNRYSLVAPCGMNCGICMAYLREQNRCPGCRSADTDKAITVVRCKIKNCGALQRTSVKYCVDCDCFPCMNLKHLDKRYRTKYNMSMIENLECIKTHGIRAFARKEKLRWTCSECGGTICVHRGYCYGCGNKPEASHE
ncbi:MAG: hypothetical protein H6Q30_2082 [Bacteroidetes bacterium]|nr:hypothetical protein [Bacteroidota bacterium]